MGEASSLKSTKVDAIAGRLVKEEKSDITRSSSCLHVSLMYTRRVLSGLSFLLFLLLLHTITIFCY